VPFISRIITGKLTRERPFCLFGPAGSGKTTLIQDFSARFSNFIRLDLETQADRSLFPDPPDPPETLRAISFLKERELRGTGTLLLLDEIGRCPAALRWIAELTEWQTTGRANREENKVPALPFIVATSSFWRDELAPLVDPVKGFFRPVFLPPFSFKEFLVASGDEPSLASFREVPVPGYAHERLLRHFHRFSLIGGMPGVISAFSGGGLPGLKHAYETIGAQFLRNLAHVAPDPRTYRLAADVLQNAYPFAATRIAFRDFGNLGRGSRETIRAFRALENLFFCRVVPPHTGFTPAIPADPTRSPRLHLADTGLVNYFSGIQKTLLHTSDMNAIFHGQIARQAIGQEIAAVEATGQEVPSGSARTGPIRLPAPGFWTRSKPQSTAEIDFVLVHRDLLIPVVARSGEPGRLRALHPFIDAAPHPYAVRLHADPLAVRETRTIKGKKFYLLSLPYFLAGRIREHLDGFMKYVNP